MNTRALILGSCLVLATVSTTLLVAGPLTPPPGAPASTYKTLAQIEPRTPISAAAFTIEAPGSYYLTSNITQPALGSGSFALSINAPDVTLDLNGFTVQGGETAILLEPGASNVTIRNGTVRGTSGSGIFAAGFPEPGNTVRNVTLESITDAAILLGPAASVSDVRMINVGDGVLVGHSSIVTAVSIQAAQRAGFTLGEGSIAQHCTVISGLGPPTFSGHAFRLATGAMAVNCVARSNAGPGFILDSAAVARDCDASDNAGGGFVLASNTRIDRCTASANGIAGVVVPPNTTGWTIDRSTITNHTNGITLATNATQGAIRNNTIRGLGTTSGSGILANVATVGDLTITANTIAQVQRGIILDGGFSSIVGNAFTTVGTAITNSFGSPASSTNLVANVLNSTTATTATNALVNTQN